MPTYRSADVRMRLTTASLADTTTPVIQKKKGTVAKQQTEAAERALCREDNPVLKEEIVPFAGDEHGYNVGFVAGAPCLMVKVGGDSAPAGRKKEKEEPARDALGRILGRNEPKVVQGVEEPRALVLHVSLGERSFFACPTEDGKPQQLMVDVLFNGMLAGCALINVSNKTKGLNAREQMFSGTRMDYLIERPWAVMPGGRKNKSDRDPQNDTADDADASERWREICDALMKRADERGFDDYNTRPPSGDYLEGLATMEMPERLARMQGTSSQKFGVIDVVVTSGAGKKAFASGNTGGGPKIRYLYEPTRMQDSRYKPKQGQRQVLDDELDDGEDNEEEVLGSDQDAEGETDSEFEDGFPRTSSAPPPQCGSSRSLSANTFSTWNQPFPQVSDYTAGNGPQQQVFGVTINPVDLEITPSYGFSSSQMDQASTSGFCTPFPSQPPQAGLPPFGGAGRGMGVPWSEPTGLPNISMSMGISGRGTFTRPGSMTDISSYAQHYRNNGHVQFDGNPFPPSSNARPANPRFTCIGPVVHQGPLPPVGLFSVPRPKLTGNSGKTPRDVTDSPPVRSSILVSRLVVYRKGRIPIIDHRWSVPQLVMLKKNEKLRGPFPEKKRARSSSDSEYEERPITSRARGNKGRFTKARRLASPEPSTRRASLPGPQKPRVVEHEQRPSTSQNERVFHNTFAPPSTERFNLYSQLHAAAGLGLVTPFPTPRGSVDVQKAAVADRMTPDTSGDARMSGVPPNISEVTIMECAPSSHDHPSHHRSPSVDAPFEYDLGNQGDATTDDRPHDNVETPHMYAHPAPASIQRATSSFAGSRRRHIAPGVHGPKMNPIIFDDPEELLKKQKRAARAATVAAAAAPVSSASVAPATPLLSAPIPTARMIAAPEAPTRHAAMGMMTIPGHQAPCTVSRTGTNLPSSPLSSAPSSPEKTRRHSRQEPKPIVDSVSSASVSEQPTNNSQAASAPPPPRPQSRSPIKHRQRRQMSERQAEDWRVNPPLNENCIIRFAENGADGTALERQVKSERPGLFAEGMVVVGMRFFVAAE